MAGNAEATDETMMKQWSDISQHSHMIEPLVHVSTPFLLLSMMPLAIVALISRALDLELASPVVVGCLRTFIQLTVLGFILEPIFVRGVELWWLVVVYVCFMILLASRESASRTKYYFQSQFLGVLLAVSTNVAIVSIFAFCIIIRPHPLWDPQYVIPIVGMLLGNCINAIALSLNTMLTSLVEQQSEVELLLAFGATGAEASSRLVRDAVRTGAMPMVNQMSVIGLVSIPGMMTGQILGGTPAMEAARYQMLIIYLIAMCAFGTILMEVWIAIKVAFDSNQRLRTDRFIKREVRKNFLSYVGDIGNLFFGNRERLNAEARNGETVALVPLYHDDVEGTTSYVAPKGSVQIRTMNTVDNGKVQLEIRKVTRSLPIMESETQRRVLFRDLDETVAAGEIKAVSGPSGVGKSQLLRAVAGLAPIDAGDIILQGKRQVDYTDMTQWRQEVRYVTQHKVEVPGTPRDFVERITLLRSFQRGGAPTFDEMIATAHNFVQVWGLDSNCLDKEWTFLSGGEAQRVIVALALASRPKVLLLDESTAALDLDAKTRVERGIESAASQLGISVLWITHDEDQLQRMGSSRS